MNEDGDNRIAWGKAEMLEALDDLMAKAQRGEVASFAARLFKPDGTWEDIAVGGTAEERAEALASLREFYKGAH